MYRCKPPQKGRNQDMKFVAQLQKAEGYLERHWKIFLSAIFVLQILMITISFSVYGVIVAPDTDGYVAPALSFLRSGKMLDRGGYPILFRTPGYPLLLALIYGCCGQNDVAVVILQEIMILAVTWMIFSGVSQLANHAAGILASWFYIMDFVIYPNASSILTDTPFAFFVVLGAYALLRYLKTQKMGYLILCYASVNIALLIRPTIMYLSMLLFFGLLLLSLLKKISWKKTLPYLFIFLAVYGGWSLRNAACYGQPVYTSIRDDSTFLFYAPLLYAQEEGCSPETANEVFKKEMTNKYPDFENMDRLSQTAAYKDVGMAYIKKHIPGYIKMNFIGLFKELLGPGTSYIDPLPIPGLLRVALKAVASGMPALCYLLYAVGFLTNIRKQTWLDWLLLFSTLYFIASTAVLGYSRYRIAFYPFCVMGAFSCWRSRPQSGTQA